MHDEDPQRKLMWKKSLPLSGFRIVEPSTAAGAVLVARCWPLGAVWTLRVLVKVGLRRSWDQLWPLPHECDPNSFHGPVYAKAVHECSRICPSSM